jgi:hypothetical protein
MQFFITRCNVKHMKESALLNLSPEKRITARVPCATAPREIRFQGPFKEISAVEAAGSGKTADVDAIVFHQDGISFTFLASRFRNPSREILMHNKVEPFALTITLPGPVKSWNVLACDGLEPVTKNREGYLFLVVANPQTRAGIVAGWLSHDRGSGVVALHAEVKKGSTEVTIAPFLEYGRLRVEAGQQIAGETFIIGWFDDCLDGLEAYADAIKRYYRIDLPPIPKAGYCTWYAMPYGGASDEKDLADLVDYCARELAPRGFDVVQIDDGWQSGPDRGGKVNGPRADFTAHNPKGPYPSGMESIAGKIRAAGFKPGIWLLPFAWDPRSPTMANHEDWYVKNPAGEPYYVHWAGWCLDMSNPAAVDHLKAAIKRITGDWGFNYLKMDGLWSGMAVAIRYPSPAYGPDNIGDATFHDPSKTNVEAYRDGLRHVRAAAKKGTYLLGCNIAQNFRTLGASMGLLDAMRVGRDVEAKWLSILPCVEMGTRLYFLHGRVWHNDPDCLMLREPLTLDQARAWGSWIAVSGQLNIVSEWLPWMPDELVDVVKKTIPNGGTWGRPVDLFEDDLPTKWVVTDKVGNKERAIVGLFNWDPEPRDITISQQQAGLGSSEGDRFVAFDFWNDKILGLFADKLAIRVNGEACTVLSVVAAGDRPRVLSTSLHVLQSLVDVSEEKWSGNTLSGKSRVVAGVPCEIRVHAAGWKATGARCGAGKGAKGVDCAHKQEGQLVRVTLPGGTTSWSIKFEKAS